jgi:hypothetical protein
MTIQTHAELTGLPLFTTCSCTDGGHRDPQAAKRAHADPEFADIIARITGRHVIPMTELAELAA